MNIDEQCFQESIIKVLMKHSAMLRTQYYVTMSPFMQLAHEAEDSKCICGRILEIIKTVHYVANLLCATTDKRDPSLILPRSSKSVTTTTAPTPAPTPAASWNEEIYSEWEVCLNLLY